MFHPCRLFPLLLSHERKFREYLAGDRRMNQGFASVDGTDGRHDLRRLGVFEQITGGACAYEIEDVLLFLIHGKGDNPDMRKLPFDLTCGLDSTHPWHAHIHENY